MRFESISAPSHGGCGHGTPLFFFFFKRQDWSSALSEPADVQRGWTRSFARVNPFWTVTEQWLGLLQPEVKSLAGSHDGEERVISPGRQGPSTCVCVCVCDWVLLNTASDPFVLFVGRSCQTTKLTVVDCLKKRLSSGWFEVRWFISQLRVFRSSDML